MKENHQEVVPKDLQDGIDSQSAKKMTLNSFFDDYISQKQELKKSTRTNYKYMYEKHVRDGLGKRKLPDIRYSDIKKFYNTLINEKGFKPNSMEIIHTILHPIFAVAVRDGYIRTNPTDGVMAEIKKSHNWEKPKRHALTAEQQSIFVDYVREHKTYKEKREAILLPHFSAHNLRHTFCTRLCENEPNIKIIQEIMGHSDIKTTMEIYYDVTRDKKQFSFSQLEGKIKIC